MAALTGAREHAIKHAEAGVDILVVAGTEAGGHCGEVSTLVLIPEVLEAIKPYGEIPILGAGGIATGRQMAAVMAMGAHGVWTGSVWLTTAEAETAPAVKEKYLSPPVPVRQCARAVAPGSTRANCARPGRTPGTRKTRPTRCRCRCSNWSAARRYERSRDSPRPAIPAQSS